MNESLDAPPGHPMVTLGRAARAQLGLVTAAQARRAMSRDAVRGAVRRRTLEPVFRGVYRIAGVPESWEQLVLAACLAAGPDARVSFRAAARLHGFPGFADDTVEITVGRRRVRLPGVVVHDTVVDSPRLRGLAGPIPVTSVARTLCDLTAVSRMGLVARAGDDALRRGAVTLRAWSQVARDLQGRGRRKGTVTRALVEERLSDPPLGDSPPEHRVARLLRRAGLPRPVHQHRVQLPSRAARIDLAYPEQWIAIEYDGWDAHRTRTAFDDDRARANELELLGWCVLRFTSKFTDREIVDTVRVAFLAAGVADAS